MTAAPERMSPGERADVARRVLRDPSVIALSEEIRDVATAIQMWLPELDALARRARELLLAGPDAVEAAGGYDPMEVDDANDIDSVIRLATGQQWLYDVMLLVSAIADPDGGRLSPEDAREFRRTYGLPEAP